MPKSFFERFKNGHTNKQYLLLIAIIAIGFLIRLWLLDKRWINPDEGAHIMDGRLVLDGLVPEVDYGARQVVYVYMIAFFLKVFGISYINVRFLPLIATLGISLLVFLISKKLFDKNVALLATTIYTFLPLPVLESVIVKTEPLTTLLSCLGIYLAIVGIAIERKGRLLFFLSGVALSLAFYIRESSLAIPVAILLFFMVTYWTRFRLLLRNYGFIIGGYLSVCLIVFAYYTQFMTVSQILKSPINPINIVMVSLQNIYNALMPRAEAASNVLGESTSTFESWQLSVSYINLTLFTHAFLFVGVLFSVIILSRSFLMDRSSEVTAKLVFSLSLLYSWLFILGIFYLYWTLQRGFFVQYFEEFLPPLAIILAFVIYESMARLEFQKSLKRNMTITLAFLPMVFFLHRTVPDWAIKSIVYVLFTTIGAAFFYFSPRLRLKKWLYALLAMGIVSVVILKLASVTPYFIRALLYFILISFVYSAIFAAEGLRIKRDFRVGLVFIGFSLLLSASVLSFAVSGQKMGVAFDSVWSPETVRVVSAYIKMNSKEGDEVMSGAVIWELEANRRPFMNQTHPLNYMRGISEEEANKIKRQLEISPPRFIVLDRYTEETYLRHITQLQTIMDEKYELRKVIAGSRYPVKIFQLSNTLA